MSTEKNLDNFDPKMPLSELYASVDEKNEPSQQKPNDISYM